MSPKSVHSWLMKRKLVFIRRLAKRNGGRVESLPSNVTVVPKLVDLKSPDFKGALIISDKLIDDPVVLEKSVIYRPKSLVVGVGVHGIQASRLSNME